MKKIFKILYRFKIYKCFNTNGPPKTNNKNVFNNNNYTNTDMDVF